MTSLDLEPVADLFRVLAEVDFGSASPLYATLATRSADDPELLSLVVPAGPTDRLPHPLFAAVAPEVAWRRGLDRLPVDVTDDEAVRWLRACIWPEQTDRQNLLDRAVSIARLDPPLLVAGDAIESLPTLVQSAPAEAAVCIVHTAVLPYLPDRAAFTRLLDDLSRERPLWRVSGEASGLVPELVAPPLDREPIAFVYGITPFAVAGERPRPLARSGPHGTWIEWLEPARSVR